MIIGSMGPVVVLTVPPLRRRFGDGPREPIPLTYPSKFRCIPYFPLYRKFSMSLTCDCMLCVLHQLLHVRKSLID